MKHFNLDSLDKKTPYKVPENFFGEMQENVLKETIKQQKNATRIFKINFSAVTSLAAALALVLGFTFFWKTNQTEIMKPTTAKDSVNKISTKKAVTTTAKILKRNEEEVAPIKSLAKSESSSSLKNEDNDELLLNALTDAEMVELSKNDDQDIYLDLYN